MTIEESDFKLEYDEGCDKFDLYLLYTINAKNEEKRREELKLEGYSMDLTSCINRIIRYRLKKKLDIVDLKTYIKEYQDECKEIKQCFGDKDLH